MLEHTDQHPAEADLVLHYYGDADTPSAIERHLGLCPECAATFQSIADTLTTVPEPQVPERGELYGLEVWQRIRPVLPARPSFWSLFRPYRHAMAGAAIAAALLVAFLAGRYLPSPPTPATHVAVSVEESDPAGARLAAMIDHLEQSERVLVDLANAEGPAVDVSPQQAWAADLIDANRLYREAAVQAGDSDVAALLDDLERNLLDIVHAPSTLTPAELDDVRTRLDAAALLFKVRIMSNELRERETAPAAPRKTT